MLQVDSGLILKSSDGGNSWIRLDLIRPSYKFGSIFFINDNSGYVGGDKQVVGPNPGNMLFKTYNGGLTWDSILADDFIISIFF